MATPEDHLRQALQIADRIEVLLAGDSNPIPTADPRRGIAPEPISIPTHHSYTLGMYARARSYFRATLVLAEGGLHDEALTLGRSLFEDSLRLAILAKTEDEVRRIDGLIGWLLDGVTRAIGLQRDAETLGVGYDHKAVIDHLENERGKMINYRQRRGSGRRVSPIFAEQQLKNAARDGGRSSAWWFHEVGDQMVHGNYFAHRMRHVTADDGSFQVAIRNTNPRALVDVVAYAVESIVLSHQNICRILDLPEMTGIEELLHDMERLQEAVGPGS